MFLINTKKKGNLTVSFSLFLAIEDFMSQKNILKHCESLICSQIKQYWQINKYSIAQNSNLFLEQISSVM